MIGWTVNARSSSGARPDEVALGDHERIRDEPPHTGAASGDSSAVASSTA